MAEIRQDDCIINPERGKGDPVLPETGILAVNPADAAVLAAYAEHKTMRRSFLFNSTLHHSDELFLAGPGVGAPMAVMCLEKLIVLGAKRIILYGWCGSLQKKLRAMDVLVPAEAVCEEGTSPHYQPGRNRMTAPSPALRSQLCTVLSAADIDFQQGKAWTTDAPYRETSRKVAEYATQSIYGVDMEYSALCTVAAFRGVELAAVMLVSDELRRQPWQPRYSFKKFKQKSGSLLTLLCDAAQEL